MIIRQERQHDNINWMCPVNWMHPLNHKLSSFWMPIPNQPGWKSNRVIDISNPVNGYHGDMSSMIAEEACVPSGRSDGFGAWEFDGSNDKIELTPQADTDPLERASNDGSFSVEAFVFPTNNTHDNDILVKGQHAGGNPFILWLDNGSPDVWSVLITDSALHTTGALQSATTALANVWTHLVVSLQSDLEIRMWINGEEDSNSPFSAATITGLNRTSDTLLIGWDSASTSNKQFTGLVRHVKFFNDFLADSEAKSLYHETINGYPTVLNRVQSPLVKISAATTSFPFQYYYAQQGAL